MFFTKNTKMKLLFLLIIAFPFFSSSQTGPGGVGVTDGSGNLIFWVRADVGVEKSVSSAADNGDAVSTWLDQSGSLHSASSPSTGAIFTTGIFNSLPVLRFSDNDDDRLTSSFARGNNENLFLVGSNRGSTNNTFVDDGTTTNYRRIFSDIGSFRCPTCVMPYPDFISNPSVSIADNTAFLTSFEINSTGNERHWVNGNIITSKNVTVPTGTSIIIGNNPGGFVSELDGDISEIVVYNSTINSAQRIIINNYLAAKYGIILSSNDLYTNDDGVSGNYDFDVAGIGRIDASNIHNDAQGTGIVRILNPTDLDDNEFLIWGHDNGVEEATETIDVPATVQARFGRVWRVSELNTSSTAVDVGDIDIRFNLTGLGSVTASDLCLLVDTDNDGLFADETPILVATSVGADIYQFAGVSAITNNSRFTIGTINKNQTPLPIELINFKVELLNKRKVKIFWQTTSEINNDYFTIERSYNGSEWDVVKTIDGAGNSSLQLDYSTNDFHPLEGISYYRLKQTDFDGIFSYSNIESVNNQYLIKGHSEIYPNPTTSEVIISGNLAEWDEIIVYNLLGDDVTSLVINLKKDDTKLVLDLSQLIKGLYFVKTKTSMNKVYKQ